MMYAQIKDNVIKNVIVIEDISILDLFQSDPITQELFDSVIQIDYIQPRPGVGWTFDNIKFSPPVTTCDIVEEDEEL